MQPYRIYCDNPTSGPDFEFGEYGIDGFGFVAELRECNRDQETLPSIGEYRGRELWLPIEGLGGIAIVVTANGNQKLAEASPMVYQPDSCPAIGPLLAHSLPIARESVGAMNRYRYNDRAPLPRRLNKPTAID